MQFETDMASWREILWVDFLPAGGVDRRLVVRYVDEMHLDGRGGGSVGTVVYKQSN